ncbi:MAG: virulence RhuM family protein [Bacteroidaceae bacterium]|nr:virulence RhuM family protein [Bacteroidaceae bacterium]
MEEQSNIVIYNSDDGRAKVALMTRDGNVWLNQNQMAELFATSKQNIGQLIGKVLRERELDAEAVVKNYFTTATDGKQYNILYYSLEMILAVGYRVRSVRGTQFRQWATQHLSEYLIKGFTIDAERLKNPDGRTMRLFDQIALEIKDNKDIRQRHLDYIQMFIKMSFLVTL